MLLPAASAPILVPGREGNSVSPPPVQGLRRNNQIMLDFEMQRSDVAKLKAGKEPVPPRVLLWMERVDPSPNLGGTLSRSVPPEVAGDVPSLFFHLDAGIAWRLDGSRACRVDVLLYEGRKVRPRPTDSVSLDICHVLREPTAGGDCISRDASPSGIDSFCTS